MLKTALITGAARRLGAAIARSLHADGYRVAIHYHGSVDDAEALGRDLNKLKADSAITLRGDLADPALPARLVEEISGQWGRLDMLVNNASIYDPTPLDCATANDWESIMTVNLKAPFFTCQAAAPLLKRHRGSIINLTDIYGRYPRPRFSLYCASKAGLINLTRALALELAPEVRVNAISPGAILWAADDADEAIREEIIRKTPLARRGEPSDIADAVRFLAHAEFVTGQILEIDGGRTLQI